MCNTVHTPMPLGIYSVGPAHARINTQSPIGYVWLPTQGHSPQRGSAGIKARSQTSCLRLQSSGLHFEPNPALQQTRRVTHGCGHAAALPGLASYKALCLSRPRRPPPADLASPRRRRPCGSGRGGPTSGATLRTAPIKPAPASRPLLASVGLLRPSPQPRRCGNNT